MALVNRPFELSFAFSRSVAGAYRTDAGLAAIAPPGAPRFDHDMNGEPLGLLVEAGARLGEGDRLQVVTAGWAFLGEATVLHAFTPIGGGLTHRAFYTLDPRATVDALLGAAGYHRSIGAVPGFLRNKGGLVRYRSIDWRLPGAMVTPSGEAVHDGPEARLVLEA